MNWVQYTFPAISAPHDERDEEELQSWKIELNNVLDQLHLISTSYQGNPPVFSGCTSDRCVSILFRLLLWIGRYSPV